MHGRFKLVNGGNDVQFMVQRENYETAINKEVSSATTPVGFAERLQFLH